MSSWFNCGARANGERVKTKKQLKAELAASPQSVWFDGTSMFSDVAGYRGSEIPADLLLTVVGPDPYTSRRWYANVSVQPDGSLRVS
jgi:hypothetical protein